MNQQRSWAASVLGFALSVLAAAVLLNVAAHLVLEVWPVLVTVLVLVLGVSLLARFLRYRDYW